MLRRIHRTRAALRELADATYEHRAPAQAAVDEVNRALRAREVIQLVPGPAGSSSTIATSAIRSTMPWRT